MGIKISLLPSITDPSIAIGATAYAAIALNGSSYKLDMYPVNAIRLGAAITQTAHGFLIGDCIRHNGSTWVKAQADSLANSNGAGIVVAKTANDFIVSYGGRATLAGAGRLYGSLTVGSTYYLSNATAGLATTTAPTTGCVKTAFTAISSTDAIIANNAPVVIVPPPAEFLPVPVSTVTIFNSHTTSGGWVSVSCAAHVPSGSRFAFVRFKGFTYDTSGRAIARKNSSSPSFEVHYQYGRTGGGEEVSLITSTSAIIPLHTDRTFELSITDAYNTANATKLTGLLVGYSL